MHVIPIDFQHNKFSPKVSIFELDLSLPSSVDLLTNLIETMKPTAAHFGLMCGTCSRARERPLTPSQRAHGIPEPRPLRDDQHLWGRPNLTSHEQHRVEQANAVYVNMLPILFALFTIGSIVTFENPGRSWIWPLLAALVRTHPDASFKQWYFAFTPVLLDMCEFGGERKKTTKLHCSSPAFQKMGIQCSGNHDHLPWAVQWDGNKWAFDTAGEAAYPTKFSQAYADVLRDLIPASILNFTIKHFRLQTLASQNIQHRAAQQLVPEFKSISTVSQLPTDPETFKLLQPRGKTTEALKQKRKSNGEEIPKNDNARTGEFVIGRYFTPEEHCEEALRLEHPGVSMRAIPDDLKRCLAKILVLGPAKLAEVRISALKECIQMARDCEAEEKILRKHMAPNVHQVTKNKKLALWRRLLEDVGFEDMSVVDVLTKGVKLTGWEPESPLYEKRWNHPTMTETELDNTAPWRREALFAKPLTSEEEELAPQLWEETMKEKDLGFIDGPFTSMEIDAILECTDWTASQRFLLLQGEEAKPRIIDNFRTSAVNDCYGSSSYLALHDTDFVSNVFIFLLRTLCGQENFSMELSNGEHLKGKIHEVFQSQMPIQGRAVDLSKAYKQVALHPSSLKHGILAVRHPDKTWKFFTTNSLPFGASASVFEFNKVTRALWAILVRKFHLISCVYFDDFPLVEFGPMADLTTKLVDSLLNLLGWTHATTGKKAEDFSDVMTVLGVQYHTSSFWEGRVEISNKPQRVIKIAELLKRFAEQRSISSSEAAQMHGLLNFAGSFVLGRALKASARTFASLSHGTSDTRIIAPLVESTLDILDEMAPRILQPTLMDKPTLIYTDGAYEGNTATWGAVVLGRDRFASAVFHGEVPETLVKTWTDGGRKQIISQVELFAVLLILFQTRDHLSPFPIILFIDNEAARHTLLKGTSGTHHMARIVHCINLLLASHPATVWFERVPSKANIADWPSRNMQQQAAAAVNGIVAGDIRLPDKVLNYLTCGGALASEDFA